MSSVQLLILYELLSLLTIANAARILAIFPLEFRSCFNFNEAVMRSLQAAGHHITIISPFPSVHLVENCTVIDLRSKAFTFSSLNSVSTQAASDANVWNVYKTNLQLGEEYCHDVMKLKEIQEALHSAEKQYDVMFTDMHSMHECHFPIAKKLGIPIIGTVTDRTFMIGHPSSAFSINSPAIVPILSTGSDHKMTLRQRLMNSVYYLLNDYYYYPAISNKVDQFYKDYYPDLTLSLQKEKMVSLVFQNNHKSLVPRPVHQTTVEIGGIHIRPAESLPQELEKFINEAENGVILFTLGSLLDATGLSIEQRTAFVNAFAVIPQRVIWKSKESIKRISSNVFLSSWLPQRDILDHKNVKAFISHCGISGMYEAIHTGTPVVATSVFYDQHSNAALLEKLGVAVRLDLKTVTTEDVFHVLNTIINNTRYYEKMQKLSQMFKNSPMTPQESVVYWTEYVIRHNGTSHLKSVSSEMPLYQSLLLDIVFTVTFVIAVTLYTSYYVWKQIYHVCRGK